MVTKSTLFIVNDIQQHVETLTASLPRHSVRIIQNEEEGKNEFLLPQAQKAIKEAYIATNDTKYILLCGESFRTEAQNSLLKVLEEPPHNIVFILVTTTKNSILPTILSRLQVRYMKTKKTLTDTSLNIRNLELKEVYEFLKQNQRISKHEAKEIIESIMFSVNKQQMRLSRKELESFSKAMKLLELNSRPINVMTSLLLNIMVNK
jgi:DNA polymerase-3 subunit delta'